MFISDFCQKISHYYSELFIIFNWLFLNLGIGPWYLKRDIACGVGIKIVNITFPLPKVLKPPHLSWWWLRKGESIQVTWPFDHVATWQIENLISALSRYLWPQTWLGGSKSRDHLTTWSRGKWKIYMSFHILYMTAILDRVMTWNRGTQPTTSRNLWTTWSGDRLKTLCLHFHNTHGLRTWQGNNFRWRNPTHQVMWSFYHVVTWKIFKKMYLHFLNICGPQTWLDGYLCCGNRTTKSPELLTAWWRERLKA